MGAGSLSLDASSLTGGPLQLSGFRGHTIGRRCSATPGDVLMARSGLGNDELTTPQLAELLVSHGIDPAQIAGHAQFGVHWGSESSHYDSLISEFTEYAASDNPHIALVGRSGVELFTKQSAEARVREQRERVYGG